MSLKAGELSLATGVHRCNVELPAFWTASLFRSPPPRSGFALPGRSHPATTPPHPLLLTSSIAHQGLSQAYRLAFVIYEKTMYAYLFDCSTANINL